MNPAFCGELISRAVSEYFRTRQQSFSFALSFAVLPIALHKQTREQLPGNASAAFAGWVADHSSTMAEFPDRVLRLVPVTREALLFLVQHKVIRLDASGLSPGARPIGRAARPSQVTDDVAEARSAAALLGRWFASEANATSIMKGLGVSP
ncbi:MULTISPECIES: three component ABC system middle component [Bradyrhizobium]|uniref:three component ABC system middle component n=1 Tax=Bradyrhizobium TaxID=374 RepID=UPI001FCD53C2|nr:MULTISPECIES: three component ABC system middle component [Bradyrhizobium]